MSVGSCRSRRLKDNNFFANEQHRQEASPNCKVGLTRIYPTNRPKNSGRDIGIMKIIAENLQLENYCISLHRNNAERPTHTSDGAIAQLVEQRTENPCVPGSIPGGTT